MMRKLLLAVSALAVSWASVQAAADELHGEKGASLPRVPADVVLWDSIIHDVGPVLDDIADVIVHCFDDNMLPQLLNKSKDGVIVHHGAPIDAEGYTRVYSHTETLPFYINVESGVNDLSAAQADAILSGDVTNWSALGGNDIDIVIFGPESEQGKKALYRIVSKAASGAKEIEFTGVGDYAFMAETVNSTKGAVAVGLRSKYASPDNLPNATRVVPIAVDKSLVYSMPIFVYVKMGDEEARGAAMALLKQVGKRAMEDGLHYPLENRLLLIPESHPAMRRR